MPLCANCFEDHGLRLMAQAGSTRSSGPCPTCGEVGYLPLQLAELISLSHAFFVRGSFARTTFGGAPAIQFNDLQEGSLSLEGVVAKDVDRLQEELGIGFFEYGPRLWMVGHITPLKQLESVDTRAKIIGDILERYPCMTYGRDRTFYRLRKNPARPPSFMEYDSPPDELGGTGRLDAAGLPVLYGSEDLELCAHECRVTIEDELYIATLSPQSSLKILDLTALLVESETEFESLDLAVHMLFLAGSHSYPITRQLAAAARQAGFDGIIYPSFYSLLRTGGLQLETVYGMSYRRIPEFTDYEKRKVVPNLALFGRPIDEGRLRVRNINRTVINFVRYSIGFGPAL